MKKLFSLFLMLALAVSFTLPGVANAQGVQTSLTRSTGGGAPPIIKAKWEMNGPHWNDIGAQDFDLTDAGEDDSVAAGAQFNPTGVWGDRAQDGDAGEKDFTICAVVTDPDGVSDVDRVFTDWYYPSTHGYHYEAGANVLYDPFTVVPADLVNGGPIPSATNPNGDPSPSADYAVNGCGLPVEDENELFPLTKDDGIALFCNLVRNGNNNLPTFFPNPAGGDFDYDEICGATGELEKEEAYVYCVDKNLEWEDPAGEYLVEILAQDAAGEISHTGSTNPNNNLFEYLPLTGFEADFSSVDYGSVKLNTHKRISGDLTWDPTNSSRPTIRNVGNTRLYMWVEQDDMGLGTTDSNWNVQYDARVGGNANDWRYYDPEFNQPLEDILDLSEYEEMDFSIEIFKFPTTASSWTGDMTLSATQAEFRQCVPN